MLATILVLTLAPPPPPPVDPTPAPVTTCPEVLRRTTAPCEPFRKAKILSIAGWSVFGLSILAGVALPITFADRDINPYLGVAIAIPLHVVGFALGVFGEVKSHRRRTPVVAGLAPGGLTIRW